MATRTLLIGLGALALFSVASLAGQAPARKHKRSKPPAAEQAPVVKQNFRGRRADEISPWEGFEDCPLAVPCVGGLRNAR